MEGVPTCTRMRFSFPSVVLVRSSEASSLEYLHHKLRSASARTAHGELNPWRAPDNNVDDVRLDRLTLVRWKHLPAFLHALLQRAESLRAHHRQRPSQAAAARE